MNIRDRRHHNLHSIIFILKLIVCIKIQTILIKFTFYYIYIKTRPHLHKYENILYLHSIIFILKLYPLLDINNLYLYLHSIIFILKPLKNERLFFICIVFTFYYIYIKTFFHALSCLSQSRFTFYYIYIKT